MVGCPLNFTKWCSMFPETVWIKNIWKKSVIGKVTFSRLFWVPGGCRPLKWTTVHLTRHDSKINPDNNASFKESDIVALHGGVLLSKYLQHHQNYIVYQSVHSNGRQRWNVSSVASFAMIASLLFKSRMSPGTFAFGWTHPTMLPQSLLVNVLWSCVLYVVRACCAFSNSFVCRPNLFWVTNEVFASSIAICSRCARSATRELPTLVPQWFHNAPAEKAPLCATNLRTCSSSSTALFKRWATGISESKMPGLIPTISAITTT